LAVLLPWAGRKAFAQSQPLYQGPFLLSLQADGGWDTTMFFDPKAPYNDKPINKAYTLPATQGVFQYAPVSFTQTINGVAMELHSPKRFLDSFQNRLLLLNGVDTQTNAHPVGTQFVWSGYVASAYPSIGALLATKASQSLDLPCAYLVTSGGYTTTLGLVPVSRVSAAGMRNLAYQERFPGAADTDPPLFSSQMSQRIQQANDQRNQRLAQQLSMPESKDALARYNKAMLARSGLVPLVASLPSPSVTLGSLMDGVGTANPDSINSVLQQAELALYGFLSGTTVSASISLGGFDTHSNNDATQLIRLGYLFVVLDYVLNKAAELGLSDKLYVVVGSDFARTPAYNVNNGKDHWNPTSLMVFGPNVQGGRVLGATAANQYPDYVDPNNPAQLLPQGSGGIVLKPSHIHHELRRVLGLTNFDSAYPLLDTDIRLF